MPKTTTLKLFPSLFASSQIPATGMLRNLIHNIEDKDVQVLIVWIGQLSQPVLMDLKEFNYIINMDRQLIT